MRSLRRLIGLIAHNFLWKLLSLAIAMAIWWVVASEPELSTFAAARLQYKNLPGDLEIASEPVNQVSLELRGPAGELRALGDATNRPVVLLDMSTVAAGQRTFPIGDADVRLNRRVHLVRAIPSEVRFDFERRLVREVPVRVRINGDGQNGYRVANYEVRPKELTVAGPASHVTRVTAAVTDPVDVAGVVGVSEFRVNAFVDDPYVRFRSVPQVAVTVTMKKQ